MNFPFGKISRSVSPLFSGIKVAFASAASVSVATAIVAVGVSTASPDAAAQRDSRICLSSDKKFIIELKKSEASCEWVYHDDGQKKVFEREPYTCEDMGRYIKDKHGDNHLRRKFDVSDNDVCDGMKRSQVKVNWPSDDWLSMKMDENSMRYCGVEIDWTAGDLYSYLRRVGGSGGTLDVNDCYLGAALRTVENRDRIYRISDGKYWS